LATVSIKQLVVSNTVMLALMGAALFLPAGTLAWPLDGYSFY
jgi:hypothetical protein